MRSHYYFLILITTLLTSMLASANHVQLVRAEETIYIRADGSIDPPTAPIVRNEDIYTLTGDITSEASGVVVERDNIVIDGNGLTLQGSGIGNGIYLPGRENVTVWNMQIRAFVSGIYLESSLDNWISGNRITTNNLSGVMLDYSSNNSISGNSIVANNRYGIGLYYSSKNSINGNNVTANNNFGISFESSTNNSISRNNVTGNYGFIELDFSSNYNTISENNVTSNTWGIGVYFSSNNSVSGNEIAANTFAGIELISSSNNSIVRNDISNNRNSIYSESSLDNMICHNNFTDNTHQAYSSSSTNTWDDGYPSGGNYWSDYSGADLCSGPYQNETGGDGIGDIPYTIDESNRDSYPLTSPWVPPTRDVAISNVSTSKSGCSPMPIVCQGYTARVYLTVVNEGNCTETLNVTAFATNSTDSCEIGKVQIMLNRGESINLTLVWNTIGWSKGNYTISAYAEPVPGETDTADNNCTDGIVRVAIPGDVDPVDGYVGIDDIFAIASHFSQEPGHPDWNPNLDINGDDYVGIDDIFTAAQHFGQEEDP